MIRDYKNDDITFLAFDTETSGKYDFTARASAPHQPRIVSLAAVQFDAQGQEVDLLYRVIRPEGFIIDQDAIDKHHITTEQAMDEGVPFDGAYEEFVAMCGKVDLLMAFNESFDRGMFNVEAFKRYGTDGIIQQRWPADIRCVMLMSARVLKLPGTYDDYKWPKLEEAYQWMYKKPLEGAHNALDDTRATGWLAHDFRKLGYWDFSLSGPNAKL